METPSRWSCKSGNLHSKTRQCFLWWERERQLELAEARLVPRPFLCGRGERGEGRKGLVNNSTLTTRIYGISIIDTDSIVQATNTYKFIAQTLNVKPHVHATHSHETLFTTHTYLTFTFSLINADGRNAAVDPR